MSRDQIKNYHSWKNEYFCSLPSGFMGFNPQSPLVQQKDYMHWGRAFKDVKLREVGTFLQMGQICGCLLVQVGTWSDFHRALGHGGTVPFHADLRLRWLTEAFDRALIMENIQVAGWGVAGMTSPAINGPRGLGAGVYLCQPPTRMFFHMFFQMLSVAPHLPMQSEGEGQAVPSMKKGSTIWDWIFLFLGKWALRARIQYMHTITEMWCFLESKQWKLTLAHSRCITLKSFLFS